MGSAGILGSCSFTGMATDLLESDGESAHSSARSLQFPRPPLRRRIGTPAVPTATPATPYRDPGSAHGHACDALQVGVYRDLSLPVAVQISLQILQN